MTLRLKDPSTPVELLITQKDIDFLNNNRIAETAANWWKKQVAEQIEHLDKYQKKLETFKDSLKEYILDKLSKNKTIKIGTNGASYLTLMLAFANSELPNDTFPCNKSMIIQDNSIVVSENKKNHPILTKTKPKETVLILQ